MNGQFLDNVIIVKTTVLLPLAYVIISDFSNPFGPFGLLLPN